MMNEQRKHAAMANETDTEIERADTTTMGSWLWIARGGNPLPPDKYSQLVSSGFLSDGLVTHSGENAIKQFLEVAFNAR